MKVNDEKGHQAGDKYLISFSEMLVNVFPHDYVYRISGDEFVILTRGVSNKDFSQYIDNLRHEVDINSSIASIGTASGLGHDISALMKQAEQNMYEDKRTYYQKFPNYRRRSTDR